VGRSDPPWPTPAECYLAALAPVTTLSIGTSGTVAEAGPEETAKIVATVADSLIAVGALLSGYGPRGQLNVFECDLRTRREAAALRSKLRELIPGRGPGAAVPAR
jgi:hypothetical protein